MINFPDISPYILKIGPFQLRWYGLMYLLGFLAAYFLIKYQEKKRPVGLTTPLIHDLLFYLILGLMAGARLGYILFYQHMNLMDYVLNPVEIIAVWHGGMSFHGGLLGTIAAGLLFANKNRFSFWKIADRVILAAPIGLGLGRIGNFINGELYGRVSDLPWAMVFPDGGPLARHPSQLYEAFFEGLVLFLILFWLSMKKIPGGFLLGVFFLGYGMFRFCIEFFREPDEQIGFILEHLSMGQILCIVMVVLGIFILLLKTGKRK